MRLNISSSLIIRKQIAFAIMVATMQSEIWLNEKLPIVDLTLDQAEPFLLQNNFIEVVPTSSVYLVDLVESFDSATSAVIILKNGLVVGAINNCYYYHESLDDCLVSKYYLNTTIGNNIKYKCLKCGRCCCGPLGSFVPFLKEEAEQIAEAENISIDKIFKPEYFKNGYYALPAIDGRCPFLNENNECNIINHIPYNCQLKVAACMFMPVFEMGSALFMCPGIGCPDGDNCSIKEINDQINTYYKKYPFQKLK